jgi:drug/metabolite transporter (DMT)-like permease
MSAEEITLFPYATRVPTALDEGGRAEIAEGDHAKTGLLGRMDNPVHLQWEDEGRSLRPATPLWAWGILAAAVFAVSSAGVVFALMKEVPPVTLAAWRLQLTSVFLGVGASAQLRRMPPEQRQRTLRSAALLAASGSALALHFGAWVASVELTSLTHSLLFVSATPILLAAGTWALHRPISTGERAGMHWAASGRAGGLLFFLIFLDTLVKTA